MPPQAAAAVHTGNRVAGLVRFGIEAEEGALRIGSLETQVAPR
ncbi:MAG: hypothetical protein ACYTG6_05195 [Planctomycetota bacterium]|jgi:hypothetical protein